MTTPHILRGERDDLEKRAAELVAEAIDRRLHRAPHAVLGVVGGRSVGGIYRRLRETPLPWSKLHVFLADERWVPITSEESNYRQIVEDLLSAPLSDGRMPAEHAHPLAYDSHRPEVAVAEYDRALRRLGGRFDVAVLSAGEDGHVASLFPGHAALRADTQGFVLVEDAPKPPPRRVSASLPLLQRTSLGLVVFFGASKRGALARFEDPTVSLWDCPAKLVTAMRQSFVLTDL